MRDVAREAWVNAVMLRWEQRLLRMCYAYLGDVALAEDAVQETFLKAWRGYDKFRGGVSEKTWLTRIAINTCKDARRGAWFKHVDMSITPESLPDAPYDAFDDSVTRAVMALSPRLKQVALLRWYQEMSGEEIAEALSISRSTVYQRLNKARRALKAELEDWFSEK